MKQLTILGSTGSVGRSVLSIIYNNPKLFLVKALVANVNVSLMEKQCQLFKPKYAVMNDKNAAIKLIKNFKENNLLHTKVLFGKKAIFKVAALKEVDIVVSAIVGSAGLMPTIAAIINSKTILLANKESLVIAGKLIIQAAIDHNAKILPIDSEHNAIFQSLPMYIQKKLINTNLNKTGVDSIVLTGSGGPLRNIKISNLKNVTPQQACKHPNWSMGNKISVDSATMMNKGLEYIAANFLFNFHDRDIKIEIVIHPQSIIHSMVRYIDGNTIAQLSIPDMRIPILHAMCWPKRTKSFIKPIDITKFKKLTFFKPSFRRYPCLKLAIEAYKTGQSSTIILNAANEVAVYLFLNKQIAFTDIIKINNLALDYFHYAEPKNIDSIIEIDKEVKLVTAKILKKKIK